MILNGRAEIKKVFVFVLKKTNIVLKAQCYFIARHFLCLIRFAGWL